MTSMDPRALNRLIQCVKENQELLLHYDADRRQLAQYPWYVTHKRYEPSVSLTVLRLDIGPLTSNLCL